MKTNAQIADVYGKGEIRLTVEQNIIIPCEDLKSVLRELLIKHFDAEIKPGFVN